MSRQGGGQDRLQVLYLGHSARVGVLRRSLEAHGIVTRTRLTPGVAVVVTDAGVASDHPTVHTAYSLGITVLDSEQAIDQLVDWRIDGLTATVEKRPTGGAVIAGVIAVLVAALAALGILGAVLRTGEPADPVPINDSSINDSSGAPVVAPGHLVPR